MAAENTFVILLLFLLGEEVKMLLLQLEPDNNPPNWKYSIAKGLIIYMNYRSLNMSCFYSLSWKFITWLYYLNNLYSWRDFFTEILIIFLYSTVIIQYCLRGLIVYILYTVYSLNGIMRETVQYLQDPSPCCGDEVMLCSGNQPPPTKSSPSDHRHEHSHVFWNPIESHNPNVISIRGLFWKTNHWNATPSPCSYESHGWCFDVFCYWLCPGKAIFPKLQQFIERID